MQPEQDMILKCTERYLGITVAVPAQKTSLLGLRGQSDFAMSILINYLPSSLAAFTAGRAAQQNQVLLLHRSSDVLWDSKAGVTPGLRLAGVAVVLVAVAGVGSVGAGGLRDLVDPPKDPTTTIMDPGSKIGSSSSSQIEEARS